MDDSAAVIKKGNAEFNEKNSFLLLRKDILLSIFVFFNKRDLARTALTCKQLALLAKNPLLKNLPWPSCEYNLPPTRCKKIVVFRGGIWGVIKDDLFNTRHGVTLQLLPNSNLAAIAILNGNSSSFQLWDCRTGNPVKTSIQLRQDIHFFGSEFIGFSENSLVFSEIELDRTRSTIKFWDIQAEKCLREIEVEGAIKSLAKVSDSCLATATLKTIQIWNLTNGRCITTFKNCGRGIKKLLAIQKKGILISGDCARGAENTIKLWDINTGQLLKAFNDKPITDLALVSDDLLASVSRHNIELWDIKNAECVMTVKDELSAAENIRLTELIALSTEYLAVRRSDGNVTIWDIKNNKYVQKLSIPNVATFSSKEMTLPHKAPNGDLVAYHSSGHYEGSIRIWKFPALELKNSKNAIVIENTENTSKCRLQ